MPKVTTPEQEDAFVHRYCMDFDASAAAMYAGCKGKDANAFAQRMLNRKRVNHEIAETLRKKTQDLDIKARWVLNEAITNLWLAREKKDVSGANKALEIIGKHVDIQAFKENVDVNLPSVIVKDFTGTRHDEEEDVDPHPVSH